MYMCVCIYRPSALQQLSEYCDEYLVHGVDVEGRMCGIEAELVYNILYNILYFTVYCNITL